MSRHPLGCEAPAFPLRWKRVPARGADMLGERAAGSPCSLEVVAACRAFQRRAERDLHPAAPLCWRGSPAGICARSRVAAVGVSSPAVFLGRQGEMVFHPGRRVPAICPARRVQLAQRRVKPGWAPGPEQGAKSVRCPPRKAGHPARARATTALVPVAERPGDGASAEQRLAAAPVRGSFMAAGPVCRRVLH